MYVNFSSHNNGDFSLQIKFRCSFYVLKYLEENMLETEIFGTHHDFSKGTYH